MTAVCDGLKEMLQSAVQSVQWTVYSMVRVLVWGDGCYNGAIKTRKTVQPVEVSTEEAALSRSEQLRELYDSLASGELQVTENQPVTVRRPSMALSPEDLTESEWFYLMCISFSFPPAVGLVGDAYAKQQHLCLTGANEADSKVFTRVILAKSTSLHGLASYTSACPEEFSRALPSLLPLSQFFMDAILGYISLPSLSPLCLVHIRRVPHGLPPCRSVEDDLNDT
ncbi:hypothetical protein L1987_60416 [Smallanthus sonchifolius]|uniref:Uncharacterized protein n=1 Tax=Smallanthus sonchifolius TaxID=185202 RepID=A0ACB9D8U4_9ASTR|nr:hypothetical protein L1987_60416 [Smallanthus sonchifolius]